MTTMMVERLQNGVAADNQKEAALALLAENENDPVRFRHSLVFVS
jgi:hypothetical protein